MRTNSGTASQLITLSEQSDLNPHLRQIRVVRGKIETPSTQTQISSHLPDLAGDGGKVDTIVSEPIGVLLFHERMVSLPFSLQKGRYRMTLTVIIVIAVLM